jgi:hypothetical protein
MDGRCMYIRICMYVFIYMYDIYAYIKRYICINRSPSHLSLSCVQHMGIAEDLWRIMIQVYTEECDLNRHFTLITMCTSVASYALHTPFFNPNRNLFHHYNFFHYNTADVNDPSNAKALYINAEWYLSKIHTLGAFTRIYMYRRICLYTYMKECIHMYMYILAEWYLSNIHTLGALFIYEYTYKDTYTYVCTGVFIWMNVYICIHIHKCRMILI